MVAFVIWAVNASVATIFMEWTALVSFHILITLNHKSLFPNFENQSWLDYYEVVVNIFINMYFELWNHSVDYWLFLKASFTKDSLYFLQHTVTKCQPVTVMEFVISMAIVYVTVVTPVLIVSLLQVNLEKYSLG